MSGNIDNGAANGQTFQSGDTINNAKNINVTVSGTNANAPVVTINNASNATNLTIRTLANQTIDASLFAGVSALINTSNGVGTALTVTNGALATTYGVGGTTNAGGLTVGIRAADLTGTANTLNLTAAGAGSTVVAVGVAPVVSAQTITMASSGVESVALATSGINVLTLVDTPAVGISTDYATVTITGAGANTIDVSALTQTLTSYSPKTD